MQKIAFRNKGVKVLAGPFLRSKILSHVQNTIFLNGKHIYIFFYFIDKFLKFEEMEYLIHHVRFEMWLFFCKFPILLSKGKLKLEHNFSQFINSYSKLELWSLGLRVYFQVFANPQRNEKL